MEALEIEIVNMLKRGSVKFLQYYNYKIYEKVDLKKIQERKNYLFPKFTKT